MRLTLLQRLPLAAVLLASACAGRPDSYPTTPDPTPIARPEAGQLGFAVARCHTVARAGASTPGVCTITQRPGRNPLSTGIKVTADLQVFGRSGTTGLVYVTGGEWDLDVSVPAGFAPGTVPITFRITDAQGRSNTSIVPLIVQ